MKTKHFSVLLDEEYYEIEHKSGLRILVFSKPQFNAAYALIGTRYGSVNTGFNSDGIHYDIPDGTAHFLEHKLFEGKKETAFDRFARTGASANAYTSFDKTAYLFSATEMFYESLEILLDFVSHPYFTKENIAKEQGIIGQEIEMYDDDPGWQTFFRAIDAAYVSHPLKKDIAGTRETIATLTPELLNAIYGHFYSAGNMTLCVAGNIDATRVEKIADKAFTLTGKGLAATDEPHEPDGVSHKRVEKHLAVSKPMFGIAIKTAAQNGGFYGEEARKLETSVGAALDLSVGPASELYSELIAENLVSDFGYEYMLSESYGTVVISGCSDKPDTVRDRIFKAFTKLRSGDFDMEVLEGVKRSIFGGYAAAFDSTDNVANMALTADFIGSDVFYPASAIREITVEDIKKAANTALCEESAAMAVIVPEEATKNV